MAETEIIAQQPQADGIFRPAFLEERQAWVCQRLIADGATLKRETYGARMQKPGEEPRFSPFYILQEGDAQAQCDMLNGGAKWKLTNIRG